jgi:predicted glycosyl hydrolase (DUF1957 family)
MKEYLIVPVRIIEILNQAQQRWAIKTREFCFNVRPCGFWTSAVSWPYAYPILLVRANPMSHLPVGTESTPSLTTVAIRFENGCGPEVIMT